MKRTILCCLFSALVGGAIAGWLTDRQSHWSLEPAAHAQQTLPASHSAVSSGRPDAALLNDLTYGGPTTLTPEEQTNIRVYDTANRSTVNINTQVVAFDFLMVQGTGQGSGSGTVLDRGGHILTNNHVVEDARAIKVTLANGKTYDAELVGADSAHDIAVLKIDAPAADLYPITLGASEQLKVGQRVYALGNPFGLEGTLTTGIISNVNRTLPSRVAGREMQSIIQTDAALNPGNSGGPLLDTSGRMIGMNVAIATASGQNAGVGFAIPINRIRRFVPELIQNGRIVRADIGIVAVMETDEGLQIVRTNQGGPAELAGLRGWRIETRRVKRGPLVYTTKVDDRTAADFILAVDGEEVDSAGAFVEKVEQRRPGDTIELTILRDGQHVRVPVKLGEA
jgi:S1-C subfamily serine protease